MFKEIVRFEIAYQMRQPLVYFAAAGLFLFALMWTSTDMCVADYQNQGNVLRNAPIIIIIALTGLSAFASFVATAFVASAVLRDFDLDTHMLFFAKPVRKRDYLMGRFTGAMIISTALFVVGPTLASIAATSVPWQEPARVGALDPVAYLFALVIVVVPNTLMFGAVFFAVAIWSRSWLATYVLLVVFHTLQEYAQVLLERIDNTFVACLLEPIGISALQATSKYWTVTELNSQLPAVTGALLANRLAWLTLAGLLLAWSTSRFSYARATAPRWWARRRRAEKTA